MPEIEEETRRLAVVNLDWSQVRVSSTNFLSYLLNISSSHYVSAFLLAVYTLYFLEFSY